MIVLNDVKISSKGALYKFLLLIFIKIIISVSLFLSNLFTFIVTFLKLNDDESSCNNLNVTIDRKRSISAPHNNSN